MIAIEYDGYNLANITREYEDGSVEVELFLIEENVTVKQDSHIVFSKENFEKIKIS